VNAERPLRSFERAYLGQVRSTLKPTVPSVVREAAATYARTLLERGFPVIFDQQHLSHVTAVPSRIIGLMRRDPERFYAPFLIAKRNGGSRLVNAPSPELKKVQHWIQKNITSNFLHHSACHGFVKGRSIVTNADPHVGAPTILKLDIQNFFGSVFREDVYRAFRFVGYTKDVANLLTELTTLAGSLPQGAPTSPDLANYGAYRLDVRLTRFAETRDLVYTRYADDLTFSGSLVPFEQRTIEGIMRDEGFRPNEKKLRYLLPDERQAVTGVVVNERLNWPRWRRRWLSAGGVLPPSVRRRRASPREKKLAWLLQRIHLRPCLCASPSATG
jgi:RNA-directed DNA polymerase